ncbi:MAG TPA: glycerate kinase [Cellulomonas sp.]
MTTADVVVALDKLKGSLTAAEASAAVAEGLRAHSVLRVVEAPVSDGGEGTVEWAVRAGFFRVAVDVTGPDGQPVRAAYARRGDAVVVEMAQASGLALSTPPHRPLTATSRGTGELVRHALEHGARHVVLGAGGSATTDGGAGLLQALGALLLDAAGHAVPPGGGPLTRLHDADLRPLQELLRGAEIVVATDVDNPLLGPDGAAAVFGPQKGAGPQQVAALEDGLAVLADVLAVASGRDLRSVPGAGAAGGLGLAALACLGARREPGFAHLARLTGTDDLIRGAGAVVTGEGSLDRQSLRGKAPVEVVRLAHEAAVPVHLVVGRCDLTREELRALDAASLHTVLGLAAGPAAAIREARRYLVEIGGRVAHLITDGQATTDAAPTTSTTTDGG